MALVAGRVFAALVLLLAAGYMLQIDDSVAQVTAPAPPAPALAQFAIAQAGPKDPDYFVSRRHHEYVPFGARVLNLPILMYHYVHTPPSMRSDMMGYRLSVSPQDFQAQMDWLGAHGYHAVNFNDVRAYFAGTRPLPPKPFVITLDDGYQDLYTTALPILSAHRFTAVAYIVSSFVDQPRYVTHAQVVEMDRAGIQIASHTVHHTDLARTSYGNALYELVASKQWLEKLLGHPVLDFAYPSGKFNAQVMAAVRQAGYETAVTEQFSTTHSLDDRYAWTRVRVGGGESLGEFVVSLGSFMPTITVTKTEIDVETSGGDPAPRPRTEL